MLNYIWAALVIFALVFGLWADAADLQNDVFRNGQALAVKLKFSAGADPDAQQSNIEVIIDAANYARHFGTQARPAGSYGGILLRSAAGAQVRFGKDAAMPQPLATMRDYAEDKELRAVADELVFADASTASAKLRFDPVRFVKLRAITQAAFEFAKIAVTVSLGLIGILALWLGLMKIGEASGLIAVFVTLVQPILRPLFPSIPRDHPALGMIALNMAANVLGLGNAATPFGLKAMEQMQKLNPTDDTATDSMVMLMAINTAGVQLVPSAMLVSILGLGVAELFVPILIVTGLSLIISVISCKIIERLPAYRRTNPNLAGQGV